MAGARSGSVWAEAGRKHTAAPAASMAFCLTQLGVALYRNTYDLFCILMIHFVGDSQCGASGARHQSHTS
jgi:hypothetical protein